MEADTQCTVCPGHSRPVQEIFFSERTDDGTFFISACLDKQPMLRDGDSGDWIGTFQGHKGAVWSAKLSPDATQAATGSADFSAKLWDALTGDELASYAHGHIVKSVDFSRDGRQLATGGRDRKLRVFDVRGGTEPVVQLPMHGPIRKLLFHPSGPERLIAGMESGALLSVDTRSGEADEIARFEGPVKDIEAARDGSLLSVAAENCVTFFGLADLAHERQVKISELEFVDTVTLHPTTGATFVAAGGEDSLLAYECDSRSGEVLWVVRGHHGPIRCLRYAPNGEHFASGSEDGTIRLWAKASGAGGEEAAEEAGEGEGVEAGAGGRSA